MKVIDKIGNIITYILIFLISIILIFMTYSYISLNIQKKDYVSLFGYTYFEIASGSMEPAVYKNDLVIVKLNSTYQEKDIITYNLNKEFITHRVIQIDSKTITTKGDANNSKDAKIKKENVLGKVVLIIPKFGIWKKVIMTPKVFSLLTITLVLFSFTFSYNNKSKRKKLKKQKEKRIQKEKEDKMEIPILKDK